MEKHNLILVNVDTDSFTACRQDGSPWTPEQRKAFIDDINSNFPDLIKWEDDGYFTAVGVFGSKNYALLPEGSEKIKTKGSGIRDQKKEPAMREMMDRIIEALIYDKHDTLVPIYTEYVQEALNVRDITRWCKKATLTEAVMECKNPKNQVRKQEKDIWDAIKNIPGIQQGDKFYLYPVVLGSDVKPGGVSAKTGKPLKDKSKEITGLRTKELWTNDHNPEKLVNRVYDTILFFDQVLNMDMFTDYGLKRNKKLLEELTNSTK